jgi:hypothetical protein
MNHGTLSYSPDGHPSCPQNRTPTLALPHTPCPTQPQACCWSPQQASHTSCIHQVLGEGFPLWGQGPSHHHLQLGCSRIYLASIDFYKGPLEGSLSLNIPDSHWLHTLPHLLHSCQVPQDVIPQMDWVLVDSQTGDLHHK